MLNKIFVKDPERRLGAGPPGSGYDIAALKAHPFFDGVNWDKLDVSNEEFDSGSPTISLDTITLNETSQDMGDSSPIRLP